MERHVRDAGWQRAEPHPDGVFFYEGKRVNSKNNNKRLCRND